MNNNEWITDRRPDDDDCIPGFYVVYNQLGHPVHTFEIEEGHPWKPIPKCEPYVKPKRFTSKYCFMSSCWAIYEDFHIVQFLRLLKDPNSSKECTAAERIAAICEEVVP